jgi:hypothetical protein
MTALSFKNSTKSILSADALNKLKNKPPSIKLTFSKLKISAVSLNNESMDLPMDNGSCAQL